MGLDPLAVFDSFARVFGEMTFSFGFLHCDPHPGNALVRVAPAGPPPRSFLDLLADAVAPAHPLSAQPLLLRPMLAPAYVILHALSAACELASAAVRGLGRLARALPFVPAAPVQQQVVLLDHGLYRELQVSAHVCMSVFARLLRSTAHPFALSLP